ncbi:hypothetical protein EWM64_g10427 [Hericium alpestre]|uniref:F-box domain-containing protein n=1 Tax=Hericium alpestre TaxID=135208 RepID=A0A4Y9ZGP6_9AGAM|nr:hypothetical protein EWM64_g10427 [Hericium alpestre]
MRFCNSVLRNCLAHHIRRLNIVCDLSVINSSDPFGPALRDALTRLVDVMASAENLAYLRISPGANVLFIEMPAMLSTLLVHPPSRSLELTYMTGLDWLENHRFVGLRHLSLGFYYSPKDVLDLLPVTASSAATLESMHLLVDRTAATLNFREGCMPYSKLRMLSIAGVNFRLTGFCAAFPKVQFIRCGGTDISMSAPTHSGPATHEPQILSELIGLDGDIESMALFGPSCKLRMICIPSQIDSLSSFARLTTAISGNSLCSLSLSVKLQEPSWQNVTRGLDAEHFFAEICRTAPRLRFLSLRMNIAIRPRGHRTDPGHHAARQREAMADISTVASPHLAGLDDLQCFHIVFAPHTDSRTNEFWADVAVLYLSNLPRVRFLVLDFVQDLICLERSEAATMHKDGVADIAEVDLDREDVERLLERYQFEGSDWRLDGVADWLRSVRSLE